MDPFEKLLRDTLAQVHYRGWEFRIGKDGLGLWWLQVVFVAAHATSGETITCHGRKWRISMHMVRSEIVQTALMAVLAAQEHEVRENFRYRDQPIFGPHFDVDRLWELSQNPLSRESRA